MGALDSQAECLAALDGNYSDAQTRILYCLSKESEAYTHYMAGEVLPCLYDTLFAISHLSAAMTWLTYQTTDNPKSADLLYYLDNYAGVSWKAIVEAWSADDFEGAGITIAFIDRMRQLIWDEPFNVIWAAKPEEQETK
ncbi:unnamed protein product [marine sediment metagenome]|uniref:Uncharacterized protein n=1 Tax=marine sediment metagenome TaxID=412755 RepID=X1V200_9ZZZZ